MEFKPVDLRKLEKNCSNVYEAVVVAAKRARQINAENKLQFNTELSAIAPGVDDDFEDRENPEQMKISLAYENRPKPHLVALEELIDGDIEFEYKEDDKSEDK